MSLFTGISCVFVGGILFYSGYENMSVADVIDLKKPPPHKGVAGTAFASNGSIASGVGGAISSALDAGGTVGSGKDAYKALHFGGRIDQGVDLGGAGPVGAVYDGVVLRNTIWPGWPGVGGVVYKTAHGNIFVMEDFHASVHVGQRVKAGQIVGHATGGSSAIETGWANASGTGPLTPYNGAADGTPMPAGKAFARLIGV